ncbi:hypothetical protein KKD03_00190 [Patescibacteria group bacterium]|nr:hypothetical protein [Patescibacteria group bacterium]
MKTQIYQEVFKVARYLAYHDKEIKTTNYIERMFGLMEHADIFDRFLVGEKERSIYKVVKDERELIEALDYFEKELGERCGLPD